MHEAVQGTVVTNLVRKLAAIVVALGSVSVAQADFILQDEGITTFDPSTGLQWLDLTATTGISINEFLAGSKGLVDQGFRLATTDEVATLFISGGIAITSPPPVGTFLSVDYDATVALQALFGCTARCEIDNRIIAGFMLATIDHGFTYEIADLRLNGIVEDEVFPSRLIFDVVNEIYADISDIGVGLYVVRDWDDSPVTVPEPGTIVLFGIGLLGMGAARRRRKA